MSFWRHIRLGIGIFVYSAQIHPGHLYARQPAYEAINENRLNLLLQQDCALAIPWASWCSLCLEELPILLPALKDQKNIKPIVIDLSRTYVQQNFSKPFLEKLDLPYTTYRVPKEELEPVFRKRIDPNWNGDLPYAVLFRCEGKKCSAYKQWKGKLQASDMSEIQTLCSSKPQHSAKLQKKSR